LVLAWDTWDIGTALILKGFFFLVLGTGPKADLGPGKFWGDLAPTFGGQWLRGARRGNGVWGMPNFRGGVVSERDGLRAALWQLLASITDCP